MPTRLPLANASDPERALEAFWEERRAMARAALVGLDWTGAVRPSRAGVERAWLRTKSAAGSAAGPRASSETLDEPQGPRRRRA